MSWSSMSDRGKKSVFMSKCSEDRVMTELVMKLCSCVDGHENMFGEGIVMRMCYQRYMVMISRPLLLQ